mmetsp:Transcript_16402/g.44231  ORF Transcript_16402/g.44231 Transcript_16402/m.44231 type:complete len:92 (+) Transcript_16402:155-430(+)
MAPKVVDAPVNHQLDENALPTVAASEGVEGEDDQLYFNLACDASWRALQRLRINASLSNSGWCHGAQPRAPHGLGAIAYGLYAIGLVCKRD